MLCFGPETQAKPVRGTAGAASPLVSRVAADLFGKQRVDAAVRIETKHARQAAVEHGPHVRNRQRSLGDVGGDDDFAPGAGRDSEVLLSLSQLAVQRHHIHAMR